MIVGAVQILKTKPVGLWIMITASVVLALFNGSSNGNVTVITGAGFPFMFLTWLFTRKQINYFKKKELLPFLLVVCGIPELSIIHLNEAGLHEGRESFIIPLLFLLLAVTNVVLAVRYAKQTNRSPVGWGIGALLAPYICNVILVSLPVKKVGSDEKY
jgi:4-amino-4-deoxy-L-arabinose transferase-like glycosyltransferase